jgi:anthranilate synthase component 1
MQLHQTYPTLQGVAELARDNADCRRVPVMRELMADDLTTIEVTRRLRGASHHVFLLESAEPDQRSGRYSFLGFDPTLEVTCLDGDLRVRTGVEPGDSAALTVRTRHVDHPGPYLRELIAAHRSPRVEGLPPFSGGLVGFFSYDYLKYAEPTLRRDDLGHADFPDLDLMLFDQVVAFDSYRHRVQLIAGVPVNGSAPAGADADLQAGEAALAEAYRRAEERLDRMERVVRGQANAPMSFEPLRLRGELAPRFSRERYGEMVEAAKEHILAGDVFQVVLSNPIEAPADGSLFDAYRLLRCANPSPYMFYFTSDDVEVAGASPETLARLEDGRLLTYPLAGTRPRGATPEQDEALERELLRDAKELAEHNMLVDLGRNDLGRIAQVGSVRVERLHQVLRFSHVMHIGSTVSARIDPRYDAVDAIDSILPAGTLSGAPKIRACQIIGDLEGSKRGIYGGAIGYLDFAGNMDTCIGIRLAYKKGERVCVQSGAGIVADSDPSREFAECQNKARPVVEALLAAEGGIDR